MGRYYFPYKDPVLRILKQADFHPIATWIFHTLKPDYPDLALSTVTRNLIKFRDRGLISEVRLKAESRWDICTSPHYHFYCSRCGALYNLDLVEFRDIDQIVSVKTGFKVVEHKLFFTGLCDKCLRNEPISGKIGFSVAPIDWNKELSYT